MSVFVEYEILIGRFRFLGRLTVDGHFCITIVAKRSTIIHDNLDQQFEPFLLLVFWAMVLNFVNFVLVEYCNMIPIFEYQTPALHSGQSFLGWIVSISLVGLGYVCALTTYVKFYRRYVEEAILGFLLEVPPVK